MTMPLLFSRPVAFFWTIAFVGFSSLLSTTVGAQEQSDAEVPNGYEGSWRFVALERADAAAYFSASQASRAMLYRTLGWGWPTSKQTLESNTDTIEFHLQQHQQGVAYTYSIRDLQHRQLRGAIFIAQPQSRRDMPGYQPSEYDYEVTFWLNETGQLSDQGGELVADIVDWLVSDWGAEQVLFPAHQSNIYARNQFEKNGFQRIADDVPNNEVLYRFRAR